MTGSVSVNENGDRNEDYAVYDFRPDGMGRGNFTEVGRYYGFEQKYVQTGQVSQMRLLIFVGQRLDVGGSWALRGLLLHSQMFFFFLF